MTDTAVPHVARQLLLASRPLSWINTAFPFAAAYLLTTGTVRRRPSWWALSIS